MNSIYILVISLCVFTVNHCFAEEPKLNCDTTELVFSGVHNETSEPQNITVFDVTGETLQDVKWVIEGTHPDAFTAKQSKTSSRAKKKKRKNSSSFAVSFTPAQDQIGVLEAQLTLQTSSGARLVTVPVYGLSAVGVEGEREPGLHSILQTIGCDVDNGWPGIHTHVRSDLSGAEIPAHRFKRAHPGMVDLKPVARYSPNFLLPFGYYRTTGDQPTLFAIGTLGLRTKTNPQHNCIHPKLNSGNTQFDPGEEAFGVFTSSPSHITYSEDSDNAKFEPKHVAHALRVFPARNRSGDVVENSYLLCFEEASNGDYQDYVFILSNVTPVQ